MEESSTYQAIVAQGVEKGLVQGRVLEARNLLIRLGRKRFGSPDKRTRATLTAITDVAQLETLNERLLEVSDWNELLAPSTPKRRGNGHKKNQP